MKRRRTAFTLIEVILAIALSAVLLTLIGTAINLYLVQVDAGRTRVEEAQLARSILSMIADDIRATSIYKPQDTSAIAQLMSKTKAFDVDSIDKPTGTTNATSGTTQASAVGPATAATAATAATSATSATSSSSSSTSADGSDTDNTLPLGLTGTIDELYVDATRLPKQEELFATTTGYTNAQSPTANGGAAPGTGSTPGSQSASGSGGTPASDLKNVHYFIRPGEGVELGSASVTSLDPAAQLRVGGLVRQEIPRAMRQYAETNGGTTVLDSGAVLVAPEVVRVEFHYFNGSEVVEAWDMNEQKSLPMAVEVRIWLRSPDITSEPVVSNYDVASLTNTAREYRQVVYLPMAPLAQASQTSNSTDSSSTDSTDSSSSSSSSTSGSSFGDE